MAKDKSLHAGDLESSDEQPPEPQASHLRLSMPLLL